MVFSVHENDPIPFSATKSWKKIAETVSKFGGTIAFRMPKNSGQCWNHKGVACLVMENNLEEVDIYDSSYYVLMNNAHLRRELTECKEYT